MIFSRWVAAVSLFGVSLLCASDWPQWRGPMRDGHVPDGVGVPDKLPQEPKVVWRMKVGEGLASPVVAGWKGFFLYNPGGRGKLHAPHFARAKEHWKKGIEEPLRRKQGTSGA